MSSVYIDGVGMTKFGKLDGDLKSLLVEAGRSALTSSRSPEPQAIFIGAMNTEEFTGTANIGVLAASALGFLGIPAIRVETASSSGAAAFSVAYSAVASGLFERVLVIAGEKMTGITTSRATRILAEVIELYEKEAGASMPALAAMITQAYMRRHRIPRDRMEKILASVAIKNHFNGSLNPFAQFQKRVSLDEYMESKMVAEPLRLYDCSPISDGAAALMLTRDVTDVRVAGIGQGTDTLDVRRRTSLTSFVATRIAARQAYDMAGLGPGDIDFAEVHDAFTSFEIINYEDLGFFEEGKGWRAAYERETILDGEFPVNPSGGLKARGHPVGASGLAQIVDVVWQMREKVVPERRVGRKERALTHSIGGIGSNNFVIIVEKVPKKSGLIKKSIPYGVPIYFSKSAFLDDPGIERSEGTLETFTVLHVTPEGFPSPLILGFVLLEDGERLLARAMFLGKYKLGEKVIVEREGNAYFFRKATLKEKVKYYLRLGTKKAEKLMHSSLHL